MAFLGPSTYLAGDVPDGNGEAVRDAAHDVLDRNAVGSRRNQVAQRFAMGCTDVAGGSVVVDEVLNGAGSKSADWGWDAKENEFVNMVQAGIIDPAKVVRSALQNASSIAGMMLTTETLITDLKKKDEAAAGAEI